MYMPIAKININRDEELNIYTCLYLFLKQESLCLEDGG